MREHELGRIDLEPVIERVVPSVRLPRATARISLTGRRFVKSLLEGAIGKQIRDLRVEMGMNGARCVIPIVEAMTLELATKSIALARSNNRPTVESGDIVKACREIVSVRGPEYLSSSGDVVALVEAARTRTPRNVPIRLVVQNVSAAISSDFSTAVRLSPAEEILESMETNLRLEPRQETVTVRERPLELSLPFPHGPVLRALKTALASFAYAEIRSGDVLIYCIASPFLVIAIPEPVGLKVTTVYFNPVNLYNVPLIMQIANSMLTDLGICGAVLY